MASCTCSSVVRPRSAASRRMYATCFGVAYVPGAAFYAPRPGHDAAHGADARTLRLSFVTLSPEEIANAVAILGALLREHLDGQGEPAP